MYEDYISYSVTSSSYILGAICGYLNRNVTLTGSQVAASLKLSSGWPLHHEKMQETIELAPEVRGNTPNMSPLDGVMFVNENTAGVTRLIS